LLLVDLVLSAIPQIDWMAVAPHHLEIYCCKADDDTLFLDLLLLFLDHVLSFHHHHHHHDDRIYLLLRTL
jgi:hypothetical protein